ncbi:MAG TPA: hypothetical protein VLD67_18780, partial [Vicinamibacterales bacterium]|nr:hypothetical protein [Vicinamibacterales bacterium]
MTEITRRDLLKLAAAAPAAAFVHVAAGGAQSGGLDFKRVAAAPSRAIGVGGEALPGVRVSRAWDGDVCRSTAVNAGRLPVRVREIVLFDVSHGLPPETRMYGEGFQMLTQTGGTIGRPLDLGNYTDPKHYRLPEPAGSRVVYGVLTLSDGTAHHVMAFGSCRRFNGALHLRPESLQVVVETEGLEL